MRAPAMGSSFRRWTFAVLLLAFLFVLGVGAVNFLVDPYALFNFVRVPGLTANKHATTDHARLFKQVLVRRLAPEAAAFGASRTEVGLDPAHPGWDRRWRPVANLGLPGAGIEEVRRWLSAVHKERPLRQVVLGLDFFMFNAYKPEGGEFLPTGWPRLRDEFVLPLFSAGAFADAVSTLRRQDPVRYPDYHPDGQVSRHFKTDSIRRGGQRRTFQRVERHAFDAMYLLPPRREYRFVHPETGASTFGAFRDILALARRDEIDLRLFISPCHARMLEVIAASGLWPEYERWKRELVSLLAAEAAAHPDKKPFPLWDFSGYNSIATEPVPVEGDRRTAMRYYWESSHYTSEAGDLVLDRLFDWSQPGRELPPDFGVSLSPENIEAHLAETRRLRELHRQAQANDLEDLARLAGEFPFLIR